MVNETAPKRHLGNMGLEDWVSAASAWNLRMTHREPPARVRDIRKYARFIDILLNTVRADEIVVVCDTKVVEIMATLLEIPEVVANAGVFTAIVTPSASMHMVAKTVWEKPPQKLAVQSWIGARGEDECAICLRPYTCPEVCFQCGKAICPDCRKSIRESATVRCPFCRVDWIHHE